jgi:hypothetical protein
VVMLLVLPVIIAMIQVKREDLVGVQPLPA